MPSWIPHPGAQEEFCARAEFECLYGGAAGPGKTDALVALAAEDIGHPRYRGIIFRRTFPRLSEIMERCHELYPRMGGIWRAGEHQWRFPTGARVRVGHMQHEESKRDYWGHQYQFIGFDELTEFTEGQYTYMIARCRSPVRELNPRMRSTTNPGGPGHLWVKERFIDVASPGRTYTEPSTGLTRMFLPGRVFDNPTIMNEDPGYVQRLRSLPKLEQKRFLYGDWEVFEGQVFSELSMRVHGCEPFDVPPEWERFMVLDWGFAKPFSVGWYAVDHDGVLYRYREWYGCSDVEVDTGLRMIAREVAQGILKREVEKVRMRIADPSIFNTSPGFRKRESVGPSIADDFNAEGVYFMKADNDRLQGWQQVHKRLRLEAEVDEATGEIVNEYPQLQVFNTHKGFWRTVPALQASHRDQEDVGTKQEDHIADELRYACMSRPITPKKVEGAPVGSFAGERDKLRRARRMSRTMGMSLEAAYRKMR